MKLLPLLVLAAAAFVPCRAAAAQGDERVVFPRQEFAAPAAGTYALPPIQPAPAGRVLDDQGRNHALHGLLRGRITLLSFVYTHCTDPAGCPLAFNTLSAVRDRLATNPVAARAQLVSLSFDPRYDTPDVMRLFSKTFGGGRPGPEWRFLTTASEEQLAPLLSGFGQELGVAAPANGARRIDHTLRVFLIDPKLRIREIYSSAYLMPDVIVNDILTLAGEINGVKPH